MGNCHSVGEQRSVRTQTLGAIPVFKPLTGQCTGMAPICIKRDLSHDGVWCGRGGGWVGIWAMDDQINRKTKELHRKKLLEFKNEVIKANLTMSTIIFIN